MDHGAPPDRDRADDEDALSPRQLALLEGLRAAEHAGVAVDIEALAAVSGYSASSIRTYFTKKLEGVLVFRDPADQGQRPGAGTQGGGWRVRGAVRCTPEAFARRMSQKAGASSDALRTEDAWRSVLRKLLYEGQRRHYHLSREELALVEALTEAPRAPGPTPPETLPLSLFHKPR